MFYASSFTFFRVPTVIVFASFKDPQIAIHPDMSTGDLTSHRVTVRSTKCREMFCNGRSQTTQSPQNVDFVKVFAIWSCHRIFVLFVTLCISQTMLNSWICIWTDNGLHDCNSRVGSGPPPFRCRTTAACPPATSPPPPNKKQTNKLGGTFHSYSVGNASILNLNCLFKSPWDVNKSGEIVTERGDFGGGGGPGGKRK